MHSLRTFTATSLALFALASSRPVHADMPPPPDSPESKRVPATIELDWSAIASHVSHKHVIAVGETLRSIATKLLGEPSRVKAIVENNPDAIKDPDRIRSGDVIWLPAVASFQTPAKQPADPAPTVDAATLAPWYDAFWVETAGKYQPTNIVARASPGELPDARKKGAQLALVPHPVAAKVIEDLAKGPVEFRTSQWPPHDENPGPLAASPVAYLLSDTLLHKEDPTVRIVTSYKLTGVNGNQIASTNERVRYDADGKVVTKTWVVPPPSYENWNRPRDGAPPKTDSVPVASPSGAPMSDPTPTPAPVGMAGTTPPPSLVVTSPGAAPAVAATEPADDSSHWPARTGLYIAIGGAALVAALWAIRQRKAAAPPPPPPPA